MLIGTLRAQDNVDADEAAQARNLTHVSPDRPRMGRIMPQAKEEDFGAFIDHDENSVPKAMLSLFLHGHLLPFNRGKEVGLRARDWNPKGLEKA
jgi:hypothetical protein